MRCFHQLESGWLPSDHAAGRANLLAHGALIDQKFVAANRVVKSIRCSDLRPR
jgi:hypothetical protein